MLTLLSLPFEILSEVLKHLPARDILRLQRVDKFFYRRLFVDIDLWLILNQFLLYDCGIQYDIPGLFSNRDQAEINATRQLVIAPCRLWKHIQRSSHSEYRRTLGFPEGYRVRCMSLLPGGRWLLVIPFDGSLDLWDVHFTVSYKAAAAPALSLDHRWAGYDISLHPESPNCFVALIEFSDDDSTNEGASTVVRDVVRGESPAPANADVHHCAVVLVTVPSSRSKSPSLRMVAIKRQLGQNFGYCGDIVVCDNVSRPGRPRAWNWRTDAMVEIRCEGDVECSKSALQDDEHTHHVIPHILGPGNKAVTSICYPDRVQRTFRLPDAIPMPTNSTDAFYADSSTTRWIPELCQPEHTAESDFHQHTLVMEYASLGRPPRARFPEFFVDVCSANGMSIGYVDRCHGGKRPPILTRPVRFYALALDGIIRIYPHEDVVLVLVLMASSRSLSNYEEEDAESRRGSDGDGDEDRGVESPDVGTGSDESSRQYQDNLEDVVTIYGFVIPIAGIYAGRFTKDDGYDHLVRSFALKEHLVGEEEVAIMRGSEEGYLDKIAYDFVSGRIVLSGLGSRGAIILDFDQLCVTGSI